MFQQRDLKFGNISIEDGLSQSAVECIIQDYIGLMWFGTHDGLNMYDGFRITVFKNDPNDEKSLPNNLIKCMLEDSNRNLWIGTKSGLCRYNRERNDFVNFHNKSGYKFCPANFEIRAICEDRNGNLWIGTYGGGLYKYDSTKKNFHCYKSKEKKAEDQGLNRVNAIHEDSMGNLRVGTWGSGVLLFDRKKEKFFRTDLPDNDDPYAKRINSIIEDTDRSVMIATNRGIFRICSDKKSIEHYVNDPENENTLSNDLVASIYVDSKENKWIATREGGLNLFDGETKNFFHYKSRKGNKSCISNNSITRIYEDRSGIIWVGTYGGGVNKVINHFKKISHFNFQNDSDNCVSSDKIYCFHEDADRSLWIGTWDNGLNRVEKRSNRFVHYKFDPNDPHSISDDMITAIVRDCNDELWIGTSSGGLNRFDRTRNRFIRYRHDPGDANSLCHDTIFCMTADSQGRLWIGTGGGGMDIYDIEKNSFHHCPYIQNENSISSNRIRTICIDTEGIVWIGTDNSGLDKYDFERNKFSHYKNASGDNSSLSSNNILSVYEDSSNNLWIGTLDGGLNKFIRKENRFKRYGIHDGLPNNSINGILEDNDSNLWISTNYGISKLDTKNDVFRNYDEKDGFQSNEFNQSACLKLSDGRLVFGGINGFNIFNPKEINDNQFIPPVIISDFKIFNRSINQWGKNSCLKRPIAIEDHIELTYRDSVISFELSVLDYNIPEKNLYAYKLEGFDKDWVYSGSRRFITYTNLDPGNYQFRVKGSNNDQVWNEEGTSVGISISPPFWKTGWFKLAGALAAAGAGNAIYKSKLNKIKKEKKAQEEFTKRLIELQENDRKKIAAELHDSIGHDLLITKNKLLLGTKKIDDKEFLKSNLSEMEEILSDTLKDIREISYTLHPYQLERLGLSKAIKSIVDRASRSTEINFTVNIDTVDKLLHRDVEINLYRIIQECINNIIKHSHATDAILNVIKNENEISILISDNGNGFDLNRVSSEKSKAGFGLRGLEERTKLLNGTLLIESSEGIGTTIKIKLGF